MGTQAMEAQAMIAAEPRPRTLIADDQPDVLEALRLLLKGAGFSTEAVTSPAAALDALRRESFDLLLMDLNYARDTTSGYEGLNLLARVRELDSELPVVVMTAWGSVDIAIEALRGGVTDFILKPWENDQLIAMLRRHIKKGRAARDSQKLSAQRQQELSDARAIQERLIPDSIPQLEGYTIAAAWEPARTVGGDYYDVLSFDSDTIAMCIGDVSGKGMPAALLMSNVQAAFRALATRNELPAGICARLNSAVASSTRQDRFISFFYCVLEGRSGRLAYANAGHNPPVLIRANGSVERLECGGSVLGPFEVASYEQCETVIRSGDRLLMFTDGVTEACAPGGEEFGEERLIKLAVENRAMDAAGLRGAIIDSLRGFTFGSFGDDVTLIVLSAGL